MTTGLAETEVLSGYISMVTTISDVSYWSFPTGVQLF